MALESLTEKKTLFDTILSEMLNRGNGYIYLMECFSTFEMEKGKVINKD
jgi:hypothetical protein